MFIPVFSYRRVVPERGLDEQLWQNPELEVISHKSPGLVQIVEQLTAITKVSDVTVTRVLI